MLTRIDLRDATGPIDLRGRLPRAGLSVAAAVDRVAPIVEAVRTHGLQAVREATARFDHVSLTSPAVPAHAIAGALRDLDPAVRAALEVSIERVRRVHADQAPTGGRTTVVPGGTVTQTYRPVSRVGLYVPGGLAVYPSSVVMNVVPAQVAGVSSIVLCSPPQPETGLPHPLVLAACAMLGVGEAYAVGGAQAIAMLAYGVEGVAPVDLITGPGNVYVTAAKRLVRGVVGIDAEAGPTEIAVLADDSADPVHVAADLISQAEHDPLAASVLVTTSPALCEAVDAELRRQVAVTKHVERITAALTGAQSGAVLVADLDAAVAVIDAYAPEHLEVQTRQARQVAQRIRNAGAIFVGPYAPVSLGDYCAGSNHVLPTGGYARYGAGLSVHTFLRPLQIVEYDEPALRSVAAHVVALAQAEDLPAHGQAITARWSS